MVWKNRIEHQGQIKAGRHAQAGLMNGSQLRRGLFRLLQQAGAFNGHRNMHRKQLDQAQLARVKMRPAWLSINPITQ